MAASAATAITCSTDSLPMHLQQPRPLQRLCSIVRAAASSPHYTAAVNTWMHNHGVHIMEFPPRSPDLNPIENLWHVLNPLLPTSINICLTASNCCSSASKAQQ